MIILDLIKKASQDSANTEIFELSKKEAEKRSLEIDFSYDMESSLIQKNEISNNLEYLKKWNWGAFILAPFWALSNKLDKWAILSLLPPINLAVVFYLGYNGNRLAFEKSEIKSVDDFMEIQKSWEIWGIRIFLIVFIVGLIVFFVK